MNEKIRLKGEIESVRRRGRERGGGKEYAFEVVQKMNNDDNVKKCILSKNEP